jgi:hypothetical protein
MHTQLNDMNVNGMNSNTAAPSSNETSSNNHLKNFLSQQQGNPNPYAVDSSLIEECLMSAAINFNKHAVANSAINHLDVNTSSKYMRPKAGAHLSNNNPHHRLSNYLAYSSNYQHNQHQSRSDSCGPSFRNSLSGIIN